jgi:hypothetical protein
MKMSTLEASWAMRHTKNFWYKVGFALEKARQAPSTGGKALASLKDRKPKPREKAPVEQPRERIPSPDSWPTADALVESGIAALAGKVLDGWTPRGKTGWNHLLKAGVAGAAAALAVEVVRPLLEGRVEAPTLDRELAEKLLVGAGQGLVYGGVVEPRIPGPSVLKGALYGSAEYAVDPMGGLAHLLGGRAPQGSLPVVADLLEGLDAHDRAYVEHVVFGIAVALLYGSSPSSNGIRAEVEA